MVCKEKDVGGEKKRQEKKESEKIRKKKSL
jgi:hypothetical protein